MIKVICLKREYKKSLKMFTANIAGTAGSQMRSDLSHRDSNQPIVDGDGDGANDDKRNLDNRETS